jgi:hypothetical protein
MLAMITTACPPYQKCEAPQRFLRRAVDSRSELELGLLLMHSLERTEMWKTQPKAFSRGVPSLKRLLLPQ